MTNLELAICEAENAGEIDLDTRDMMLSILNESTAQYRAAKRVDDELELLVKRINKYCAMAEDFESKGNKKMADMYMDKAKKLDIKANELSDKLSRISPKRCTQQTKEWGAIVAAEDNPEYRNRGKSLGREAAQKNPWRGNSKREPEVKGRYKTTNGLKESVLEEIYEAELCGDITPEERMALIDYMED